MRTASFFESFRSDASPCGTAAEGPNWTTLSPPKAAEISFSATPGRSFEKAALKRPTPSSIARRIAASSSGLLTIRIAAKSVRSRLRVPAGGVGEQFLDVVERRRGLDEKGAFRRSEKRSRFRERVLCFLPCHDPLDRRHRPRVRLFERRDDENRVAVLRNQDGREALAAVKGDAGQVKKIRRGSHEEHVGARLGELRAGRLQSLRDRRRGRFFL